MRAEAKTHVSHSTVEKQRRDRINSLIDEARTRRRLWPVHMCARASRSPALLTRAAAVQLRDLVPPQSHNSAVQDSQESKRPKHVVLSDTIALVRELRSKVRRPLLPGCAACHEAI